MNDRRYGNRTVDSLARSFNSQTAMALSAATLASIAMAMSLFRPIIAILQSLHSGSSPRLSIWPGIVVLLLALVSVVLSFGAFGRAQTKRGAWGWLCAMSLIALILSVITIIAGKWFLQLYVNYAGL